MPKTKISADRLRELINEKIPDEYKDDKKKYFDILAKKYKISSNYVKNIMINNNKKTFSVIWRRTLKKDVTKEHAVNIITDMYKEVFNKEPQEIKAVLRYEVLQIIIKPENILLQFDEILMAKLHIFVSTAYKSFYDNVKVQEHLKKKKEADK